MTNLAAATSKLLVSVHAGGDQWHPQPCICCQPKGHFASPFLAAVTKSCPQILLDLVAGSSPGMQHCIWSVLVLLDGTMVSGDASGRVQLWDGQHGTGLQAFSQHKADVLAVAASPDGNTIFATGIDVQVGNLPRFCSNVIKLAYLSMPQFHQLNK